jgi:hypothetical protein
MSAAITPTRVPTRSAEVQAPQEPVHTDAAQPATELPEVRQPDPPSPVDSQVVDALRESNPAAKPALAKPLARGLRNESDSEVGGREVDTAMQRPPTLDEVRDKYGFGPTALTHQLVGAMEKGKVRQSLQDAKWRELEAKGLDRSTFDGKAYLEKNPDVANHFAKYAKNVDMNLLAATHYMEWGRHEMRETGGPGKPDPAANAKPAEPVDMNKMTDEQKYDYLRDLTVARAGGDPSAWKDGDREVNLVGVRGMQDGKANANDPDKFNDTIYVARMVDGKKTVEAFKASTDPGAQGQDALQSIRDQHGDRQGVAQLATGSYRDAWTRGTVSGGDQGLRQDGWVRVHTDADGDGRISGAEQRGGDGRGRLAGNGLQLQFHGSQGDSVGQNSAGCQVIHESQWQRFQDILKEAPASQQRFGYTLVDGNKLGDRGAADGGGPLFQRAGYDPIHLYNEMHTSGHDRYYDANFNSAGRGFSAFDIDGSTFFHLGQDGSVGGIEGNGGIGIIRTPYLPITGGRW